MFSKSSMQIYFLNCITLNLYITQYNKNNKIVLNTDSFIVHLIL